jgi:branched-chain amino acid transport system substrate-binding protein
VQRSAIPSTPRGRNLLAPVGVLLAVTLTLVGCGSDDDASPETAPSDAPTTIPARSDAPTTDPAGSDAPTTDPVVDSTPGTGAVDSTVAPPATGAASEGPATLSPVKLGLLVDEGGASISQPEGREAVEAVIEYANDELGGLGGHVIELVTCKTAVDPASALACATELVQAGVVAVITPSQGQGAVVAPAITGAGIAYMVPTAGTAEEYTLPNAFNLTGGLNGYYSAAAQYAAQTGIESLTMFLVDVGSFVASTEAIATPYFEEAGVELSVVAIPQGTPDATAQVSAGVLDSPDALYILGDENSCLAVLKAFDAIGAEGQRWMGINCLSDTVQAAVDPGNFTDARTVVASVDGDHPTDPDAALYREIMDEYRPDASRSGTSTVGFQVALAFLRATEGIGEDVTAESVLAAIRSATNVPLPLGHGLTFTCDSSVNPELPAICGTGALIERIEGGVITDVEAID